MSNEDAKVKTQQIDSLIREYTWMDFEVRRYDGGRLTIVGSIDESRPHDIEIVFSDVFMISLPMNWKTDTSIEVFSLIEGRDAAVINERLRVEYGFELFRFVPEDYPDDFSCVVAAKSVDFCRVRTPM